MANPRIEEVEDDDIMADDPDEMDLDAFDFARSQGSLQSTAAAQREPTMTPDAMQALLQAQSQGSTGRGGGGGGGVPSAQQMPRVSEKDRERIMREQTERTKSYQVVYAVYFDSTRSREEGRRVRKEDAVPNPLARDIVDALAHIGNTLGVPLQIAMEPMKTHPKDWANPGRVRVQVKKNGAPISPKIQNKHHLYKLISEYLQSHPTTEDAPKKMQIQGLPMPRDGKILPPAVPRGFKIGKILPLHSPAMSGGGISENMMADMMKEMGGQLPAGMSHLPGMGGDGAGQQPKKVKAGKKK